MVPWPCNIRCSGITPIPNETWLRTDLGGSTANGDTLPSHCHQFLVLDKGIMNPCFSWDFWSMGRSQQCAKVTINTAGAILIWKSLTNCRAWEIRWKFARNQVDFSFQAATLQWRKTDGVNAQWAHIHFVQQEGSEEAFLTVAGPRLAFHICSTWAPKWIDFLMDAAFPSLQWARLNFICATFLI